MARQALIDGLEANPPPSEEEIESATSEACRLSIDIIKTYSRLRHTGHLRFCGFQAVSHITAAAHTLIACMLRNSNVAFEHRPDLLTAIDLLLVFSSPFPSAKTVAQLLVQVSRTVDYRHGSTTQTEAAAIRVLARKFAPPPPNYYSQTSASEEHPAVSKSPASSPFGLPSSENATIQQLDPEAFPLKNVQSNHSSLILDTLAPSQSSHSAQVLPNFTDELATNWGLSSPSTSLINESHQSAIHNPIPIGNAAAELDSSWEDGIFSFLNDGLFDIL
jgi:hypothetical protein